jgi:ribA/ribD-fused uncharacterized protein
MSENNFVFFYGGPFSQWYRGQFEIGGIKYNCAEQYMMSQKALLFGDREAYDKIMKSHDPSTQKATGKKVRNFDKDKWEKVCRKIVYDANYAKFSGGTMKAILLSTGDKEIVEASPTDTIWGIGLAEGDPRCLDKTQWRGTNWLGIAIMEVRDTFRKELNDRTPSVTT